MPLNNYNNIQQNGGGSYVEPDFTPPDAPPSGGSYGSGSWASIAAIVAAVTQYRTTNFAARASGVSDFSGSYPVISVDAKEIVLGDPDGINPAWDALGAGETIYFSPRLSTDGLRWVGPFVIEMDDCEAVVANFVCPQGLFRFNADGEPRSQSVSGLLETTPVDALGVPNGVATNHTVTLSNSPSGSPGFQNKSSSRDGDAEMDKSPRGVTLQATLPGTGRVQVRFRRTTPLPKYKNDQFTDELQIRDCYGIGPISTDHFGDVTTVHTRVQSTSAASAPKERKLQCVITRKVLVHNVDGSFGPALVASQNAADIICHMALDPLIGGRVLSEIDAAQIYAAVADAAAYFGFPESVHFNYSFDDDNLSFEEMVQTVATAIYSSAYRQGSILRLFFERATDDASLLFNHRNKLPGSETRSVRFGVMDDNDGVEFDYRTFDGQQETIFIPPGDIAVKPKKIERAGVTDSRQAQIHAERIWARMKYQNVTTEFEATAEASQLVLTERIEVADNTRPDIFDGHVVEQVGLTLELSQPFVPAIGVAYNIFLQLPTGALDVIPVTAGADEFHAVLQSAPATALALDEDNFADVVYQIVGNTATRSTAFLVAEKGAFDKRSVKVQAINYDPRYYARDQDYAV